MQRMLAIDFGEKRVGVAVTDPDCRMAIPLTTLRRRSDRQIVSEIADLAREKSIERIVVGEPLDLQGGHTTASSRVASFARKLERSTGLPCDLQQETLTSVEATQRLRAAGVDTRRHPERIDAVAAQILLEQAMAARDRGKASS